MIFLLFSLCVACGESFSAAFLSPIYGAAWQSFTNQGVVLSGGKIYTYQAGTTTPQATWTDSTQSVSNANPIVLNSAGRNQNEMWLQSGQAYKLILKDFNGNTIGTYDNISGINDTTISTSGLEWINSLLTPTYISPTQFSVLGNQVSLFQKQKRIKAIVAAGTVYGYVTNTSFFSGITTVSVALDAGALDAGLSSVYYSLLNSLNPSIPQQYNLVANVKDPMFGALLDGVTDDTVAFQAALNYLANTGGTLYIPASTACAKINNFVSVTMAANTKLHIDSHDCIDGTGAPQNTAYMGVISVKGDGALPSSGVWTGTSEITVDGLNIFSNATVIGQLGGLRLTYFNRVTVRDSIFTNLPYDGLIVLGSSNVNVTNVDSSNNMYAGMQLDNVNGGVVTGGHYDNNGYSSPVYGYGIALSVGDTFVNTNQFILINGITANGNLRKGIDVHAGININVENNSVIGYGASGLYAEAEDQSTGKIVKNISFFNNYIDGTGNTITGISGIEAGASGGNIAFMGYITIQNNTFVNTGSTSGSRAILIPHPSSGLSIDRLRISNNNISLGSDSTSEVIKVYTAAGLRSRRIDIFDNIIQSTSTTYPIYVDANDTNGTINVIGNQIGIDSGTSTYAIYVFEAGSGVIAENNISGSATFTNILPNFYSSASFSERNNLIQGFPFKDVYSSGRSIDYGVAIPLAAEGFFRQGSIRYNPSSTVGQPKGWACTVTGTPGTWVSIGNL